MVADFLGYFRASGTQGGITSGSQWLVRQLRMVRAGGMAGKDCCRLGQLVLLLFGTGWEGLCWRALLHHGRPCPPQLMLEHQGAALAAVPSPAVRHLLLC